MSSDNIGHINLLEEMRNNDNESTNTVYMELYIEYLEQKLELKKLQRSIKSFKKYVRRKDEECVICLQKIVNDIEILDCTHLFHLDCLDKIEKDECPICKEPL